MNFDVPVKFFNNSLDLKILTINFVSDLISLFIDSDRYFYLTINLISLFNNKFCAHLIFFFFPEISSYF